MNPRNVVVAVAVIAGLGCVLGWRSAYLPEAGHAEAAPATVESFVIDAVHSKALFRVHHLGAGMFYGRFNEVTGTIVFDGTGTAGPQFDVSIAAGSVDTGNDKLDGHLKSPDFFNVAEHPKLTFKSKSAKKVNDKTYEVSGDLTIHGVTKPLTAQVDWTGTAEGRGGKRCGFETVFTIKRSDFGMTYMLEGGGLGDEIRVIVSLEGMIGGGR